MAEHSRTMLRCGFWGIRDSCMSIDTQVIRSEEHREIGLLIQQDAGILIDRWERRAVEEQPKARRLHHDALLDHLPAFLQALGRCLAESSDPATSQHCLTATAHGEQRWETGWSPTEVVRDKTETSGSVAIVNGISCMACHQHGPIGDFKDTVRTGHALAGEPRDKVRELYPEAEAMARLLQTDEERFLRALDHGNVHHRRNDALDQRRKAHRPAAACGELRLGGRGGAADQGQGRGKQRSADARIHSLLRACRSLGDQHQSLALRRTTSIVTGFSGQSWRG